MTIYKAIAMTAILLLFATLGTLAEAATPIPNAATPAGGTSASPAIATEFNSINKRFLLSHSSSVYAQPGKTSAVIAHLHRGTHVIVTGITGDWLQIRLSSGKTGFVPSSAAE
jgi:uncharacterized protein YgiM (DUF1202 family)